MKVIKIWVDDPTPGAMTTVDLFHYLLNEFENHRISGSLALVDEYVTANGTPISIQESKQPAVNQYLLDMLWLEEHYYADTLISQMYDGDSTVQEVLATLIPGFEYPDWSHKTVGDVLAFAKERLK